MIVKLGLSSYGKRDRDDRSRWAVNVFAHKLNVPTCCGYLLFLLTCTGLKSRVGRTDKTFVYKSRVSHRCQFVSRSDQMWKSEFSLPLTLTGSSDINIMWLGECLVCGVLTRQTCDLKVAVICALVQDRP